jgi:integrase
MYFIGRKCGYLKIFVSKKPRLEGFILPKYLKDVERIIEENEVREQIKRARKTEHKVLIAIEYLTGARPAEVVNLKKGNFTSVEGDLRLQLPTKKGGFPRLLPWNIETTPFLKDIVLPFLDGLPDSTSRLFTFKTTTRVKQIIYETSQGRLTPYSYRHSRLTKLGLAGATLYELMAYKGAKDPKSVTPYLFLSPKALENMKDKIT